MLFNILLCELFQFFPDLDITNYADGNTPHSTNINLNKVLHDLEKKSSILFKWFADNLLKANPEKSNLLTNSTQEIQITDNLLKANPEKSNLLTNSTQEIQINIGGTAISNSTCEKLLGIHIDKKLTYEPHVRSLCKKASQKLNAFAIIACSLKFDKENFIPSQFS